MNKALTTLTIAGVPLAGIGAALAFAPNFLWQFAYNMWFPLTIVLFLTAAVCAVFIPQSQRAMKYASPVSQEYETHEWRIWTSLNVLAILAIAWMVTWAMPAPDFDKEVVVKYSTKVVEKPVIKWREGPQLVYHTPTYKEALQLCIDNTHGADLTKMEGCHNIATQASMPPYRVQVRVQRDPYAKLFDQCMSKWSFNNVPVENVLKLTHACKSYAARTEQNTPVQAPQKAQAALPAPTSKEAAQ